MHFRKVRVFYNRRSGPGISRFQRVEEAFAREWKELADDLAWYFPSSREDSARKVRAALGDGADERRLVRLAPALDRHQRARPPAAPRAGPRHGRRPRRLLPPGTA